MSNFETFMNVTAGIPGTAQNIFVASTIDNLATITATGYLNDRKKIIKPNDIVYVNYLDTSTYPLNTGLNATPSIFMVTYSASNWSLQALSDSPYSYTSAANALTAHAGGGQASALQLTSKINRVTTVATAADSVKLPAAVAGRSIVVINAAAANAMNVFPSSGESINALAADTALSVAANKTIQFFCAVNGIWNSILTA